jgi:predicted MFS family arabinose efflux permease
MQRVSNSFLATMVIALSAGTYIGSALASLSRFLIHDLDLSNTQFGLLITMFTLGGAASAPFIGRLADRVGGRRLLRIHFVLCLGGVLAAVAAQSYLWLMVSVAVTGLASASANPATNRLIARNVPEVKRASSVGIKSIGQPLSVMAAGAFLPPAAAAWGWRASLALGAVLPVAGMALLRSISPDDPRQSTEPQSAGPVTRLPLRWLCINGFAIGGIAAAVVSFLPLYSQDALGFSASSAGVLLSLAGLASLIGRLWWGRTAARFSSVVVPLIWLSLASGVSTIVLILSGAAGPMLIWIAAPIAGLSMMSWNAVGMAAIVAEVELSAAGRASGVVMSAFLAGWMITPSVFGWILDASGSYVAGWALVLGLHAVAISPLLAWQIARSSATPLQGDSSINGRSR